MPTPDAAPSPSLPADQSTQQISSSPTPEAASSTLEIILPPTQQPSPDAQPEIAITAANPLLSSVEWDPQTNTLLLPSGLEVAQILSAGPQTSIVLEDGTILRLSGLEEDVEPLIKIDDQILSAQEIQQAFAALRNVEPGAGPEVAAITPAVFTTPETSNSEPAPSFTEPEPAQGGGNNFEPISIAVQPAFPVTPLLLPSEATTAQNTPQTGGGAAQDLPRGSNITALAISPPDTETPPTLSISSVSSNLFEAGLSNGSASGQAQAQASGSWTIVQSDSPIASLSVYIPSQGQWVDVTNGGQITTDFGVLTVTKAPDGTYKWTYELSESLDHGANNLEDILNVKVTDESGKEATAPFSMQIVDDTPTIDIADAPNQIGEGETLTGSWSLTEGADGVSTLEISASGQSKSLNLSENTSAQFILAEGKLTINPDGTYSFEASKDLDHSQSQSITFTLTATDGDGDTTTDTHSISIGDGTDPTGPDLLPGQDAHLTMTVEEAALDDSGSDPSSTAETVVSSSLIFTAGSDDLDSFTFADPSSITVSQAATNLSLTWSQNGNQLLGSINGQLAIILQLDASTITAGQQGSVTFTTTLTDAFPHTDAQISINGLKVIATDTDGDQASADIRVIITDDTPTITISDSQTAVEEGETLSSSWSLTPGADGVSEITISVPGQDSQTIQLSENTSAEFVLPQGKLIVNPNGTYSFEAADDLDHSQAQSITFTLTATDGDGDTTTDTHSISISDGNDPTGPDLLPGQDTHLTMTVEEAALDNSGSDPSSSAETEVSSSLIFTAGSDDLDSFTFADPSSITLSQAAANLSLTWSQNGNQLLGSINGQLAIILQLDASTIAAGQQGSVTVTATLTDAFPHTDAQISINGLKVIATDTDGDQASADIRVIITDDTPTITISDSHTAVEEGETLSGSWSLTPGADGVSEITISVPGQDSQTIQLSENTSAEFVLLQGKLTINPDGTYSFEAAKNLDHSQDQNITFSLTATDGDGDTSADTHTITISDGTDPTGPDLLPGEDTNLILTLEEAAIDASGSNPDSPAETMVSSSLSFTAGSDNLSSFTFADPSSITVSQATNTLNLTWSGSGNQLIGSIDGQTAIILQLEGSTILAGEQGTIKITATLTKAFPHEDAEVILNAIKVVASDTDGDQAIADVRVVISDDSPTLEIADGPNTVTEGETLSGAWSLTPGADGVNEITITTPEGSSQTLQLAPGETADIEFAGKGTLTVKSDGTYTFTSDLNLDHTQAQSISFTLTATDADGDTTSDTHTISITDGPDPQGGDLTTLDLDESALPGGTDETSTAEHQTTTLQFEAGSDNITSIQFGDTSSITVRNGAANPPTTISWVLSSDNQKLTGSINGVDVIELNLTSALIAAGTTGTAQISASLLSELPHATANTVDIIITGIQVKATDSDGSQSTGLLNISIKDDTPDVDIDPSQNLVLQGETISDQAAIIGGADGLEKVFVSLDNGPAVELDMSNNMASKFYSKLGVLSVKVDGSWEFTANTGVELGINDGVQFLITVQDGDGDTDTDSHFISIKQGADPIIGTQADDVLTGTETAELIKGLKGDDILSGGGGNDRLEGGKGKDTLEGGSGSDTFVLDTSNLNLSDLIVDYDDSGEDADKLDVTELIGGEDITPENVGNYFQYSGGVLSFDQDGAGTNHQMVEAATFANPPQQVELIVDEAQAPVVVAAV